MANTYAVKVTVEIEYEVDAESWDDAEKEGWNWEDHRHQASVYSIDVTQQTFDDEDDPEDESE
jgi:hypothetical protein